MIIAYDNSHKFYEHLVVDLVCACLLGGLSGGDQPVAANSTKSRLKNDYFERLASKLKDVAFSSTVLVQSFTMCVSTITALN